MKPIYSAVVYKPNNKEMRDHIFVKCPCASKKAASAYAKILKEWWGKGYLTRIEYDFPPTIATAKALEKLGQPF